MCGHRGKSLLHPHLLSKDCGMDRALTAEIVTNLAVRCRLCCPYIRGITNSNGNCHFIGRHIDGYAFTYGYMCILICSCVFMSLVCPISVHAALRRPKKNHAPQALEDVPDGFCYVVVVVAVVESILSKK